MYRLYNKSAISYPELMLILTLILYTPTDSSTDTHLWPVACQAEESAARAMGEEVCMGLKQRARGLRSLWVLGPRALV